MTLKIPFLLAASIAASTLFYLATPPGLNAAPVITVDTLDGRHFKLGASEGKLQLLSFFSPSCAFSADHLPVLDKLQRRYSKQQLDIIAVSMPYDKLDEVQKMRQKNNLSYSVATDNDGAVSRAFPEVRFTPTTFLIDENGTILWRHIGRLKSAHLADRVTSFLSPQGTTIAATN